MLDLAPRQSSTCLTTRLRVPRHSGLALLARRHPGYLGDEAGAGRRRASQCCVLAPRQSSTCLATRLRVPRHSGLAVRARRHPGYLGDEAGAGRRRASRLSRSRVSAVLDVSCDAMHGFFTTRAQGRARAAHRAGEQEKVESGQDQNNANLWSTALLLNFLIHRWTQIQITTRGEKPREEQINTDNDNGRKRRERMRRDNRKRKERQRKSAADGCR